MEDLIRYYRHGNDTHRQELLPKMVSQKYVSPRSVQSHRQDMTKPRGLPELGEQLDSAPGCGAPSSARLTPYRLPRLGGDPGGGVEEAVEEQVWSRHGYECHSARSVDVNLVVSQLQVSPRVVSQEIRRANLIYPKFQHAMISPTPRSQRHLQGYPDSILYRSLPPLGDLEECDIEEELMEGSPQPCCRTASPAKSVNSIHWTLSPYKNLHFDRKGQGRIQGPYSREFTVTCSAPTNWLRMKWGRSKATLV